MVLFQAHNPILQDTGRLAGLDGNLVQRCLDEREQIVRRIQQVQDVLQTRVGSQMDPVALVIRSCEARQEVQIRWLVRRQALGKQGEHLREALAVPGWARPVHWR